MTTTAKKTPAKKTTAKKPTVKKPAASKEAASKAGAAKATKPVASKSAAVRKPTKPASSGVAPARKAKPAVVNAPQAVVVGPPMRKKEIIEAVVARSGMKKRDIKPVVDHLLAVMGDAMADGRELVVPPMGRVKVHKKKDAAKKTIFFAKVHRNLAPSGNAVTPEGVTPIKPII